MSERQIKDSGSQRQFESGAHRDNAADKGKCVLLPMEEVFYALERLRKNYCDDDVKQSIAKVSWRGYNRKVMDMALERITKIYNEERIEPIISLMADVAALTIAASGIEEAAKTKDLNENLYNDLESCFYYGAIQVSKHYESGANKYGANNWKLGMPYTVYIDSCMRHLLKAAAGMEDEYHIRAAAWNALCFMYTATHKPELDDMEYMLGKDKYSKKVCSPETINGGTEKES